MNTLYRTHSALPPAAVLVFLVLLQLCLAWALSFYPFYGIPVLLAFCLLAMIFCYPDFAYYLFILSIGCHILHFNIMPAHSVPDRLPPLTSVPTTSAAMPALLGNILVVAALLSWILARWARARAAYPKTSLDVPMTVFFIWVGISLCWSPDLSTGLVKLLILFCCYAGFFLTVTCVRARKSVNTLLGLLLLAGLVNAAVAVYSLRGEPVWKDFYRQENVSIYLTLIHMAKERGMGLSYSQVTAYFLNAVILLTAGMLCNQKSGKKRILLFLAILIMVYAHLTTLSKAGLLGLVAGLTFLTLLYKPWRRRWFIVVPLVFGTLALMKKILPFNWPWPERAELFLGRESFLPRSIIWQTGFSDLLQSCGFGYGAGSFFPGHNILFTILFETGVIGAFIWMWLIFRAFNAVRLSWQRGLDPYYQRMMLSVSAALLSIFTFGVFDMVYYEEFMWLLLGLLMAVVNLADKEAAGAACRK